MKLAHACIVYKKKRVTDRKKNEAVVYFENKLEKMKRCFYYDLVTIIGPNTFLNHLSG